MRGLKTAVVLGWIGVLLVGLFVVWIFYSRYAAQQAAEREVAAREAAELRVTIRQSGGEGLRILAFYASPGVMARGGSTLLCYGVANADQVRIEPGGPAITPTLSRCVEVSPSKSTVYKLVAQSGRDRKVEAEASVTVQ